ncbi:unnamed protein product, partial [Allacma fusca]
CLLKFSSEEINSWNIKVLIVTIRTRKYLEETNSSSRI